MNINKNLCPSCQEFSFIERAEDILDTSYFKLDGNEKYIDIDSANKNIRKLIDEMKEYLTCFQDIFLLKEINACTGIYEVLVSPETYSEKIINIPASSFGEIDIHFQGPLLITSKIAANIHDFFSKNLLNYDIDTGYIMFLTLSSGRSILFILANRGHLCRFKPNRDYCYQRDPRRLLFLKRLSRQIWAYFNLIEGFRQLELERKTKEAYLTETAHSLSLPVTSILIDSATLVRRIDKKNPNYELSKHLLDMIKDMQLNVQNILRDKLDQELNPGLIFFPLREACDMFYGEAAEKGCDIITSTIINGNEIFFDLPKIKTKESLYLELLYKPLYYEELKLVNAGENPKRLNFGGVSTFLKTKDDLVWVSPENFPEQCHALIKKENSHYKAYMLLNDQKIEKNISLIGDMIVPAILMNESELSLAFKNLVHNAIKYSYRASRNSDKRYIKIAVKKEIVRYNISISNYGIGIDQDELDKGLIWNARYRGKNSRDRNRPGSGLGLFHAKRIIEEIHKGTIKAQSVLQPGGHI